MMECIKLRYSFLLVVFVLGPYFGLTQGGIMRKMTTQRCVHRFTNRTYGTAYVNCGRVNRTTVAMNCTLNLSRDLEPDVMVEFQIFKEDNGVYKETAIQLVKPLCDMLDSEYQILYGDNIKTGFLKNFLQGCPVKKGRYLFRNALAAEPAFAMIPLWNIKFISRVFRANYDILIVDTMFAVTDDFN